MFFLAIFKKKPKKINQNNLARNEIKSNDEYEVPFIQKENEEINNLKNQDFSSAKFHEEFINSQNLQVKYLIMFQKFNNIDRKQ